MVRQLRNEVKSYDLPHINDINNLPDGKNHKIDDEQKETNFIEIFNWRLNLSKRGKICFGIFAFIVLLIISGFICFLVLTWKPWSEEKKSTFDISQLYNPSDSELGKYDNAAISTDAGTCAKIGKEALMKDGTAVDAAIATLLCMGVVNCHSMGLGGGFIMTFYNKKNQEVEVLDAREVAPEAAEENMFNGNQTNAQIGGLAIAVPGELLGYEAAYKKHGGKIPWKELFIPTIELCRNGFPVGRHLAKALQIFDN